MPSINGINHAETISTSNSTTQTVVYHTATENSSGQFIVNVFARRASDGATKSWSFSGNFKRITGDATTSFQLLSNLGTSSDLLAMLLTTCILDNNNGDVRIRVNGLNSTNIDWYGEMIGYELAV